MIQHIKTIALAALIAGVSLTKVYAENTACPTTDVAKATVVELG